MGRRSARAAAFVAFVAFRARLGTKRVVEVRPPLRCRRRRGHDARPVAVPGQRVTGGGSLAPSLWTTDELLEDRTELRLPREPVDENRVDPRPLQREHLLA